MTVYGIIENLSYLSPIILLIGILLNIYAYRNLDHFHKCIFYYLSFMLLLEFGTRILEFISHNNLILLPIYSVMELVFFVYFYNKFLFAKPNKVLIGFGVIASLFIIAEIIQYFVINTLDVKQFQPYAKVADNFVVIVLALAFFYQRMNNFKETKWDNFRLNTVILVFFTFNTMIFLPFNFLVNESSGVKFYFWIGNLFMTFFFYVYLTSLIWKNGTANKKISRHNI